MAETKDAPKAKAAKEPTVEERVTALEAAVGIKPEEAAPVVAPEGPPAPHELYVPGEPEE